MLDLAVLSFQFLARTTPGDEYLALGLADSLKSRLSRLKQFVVRPTSSVLRFRGPGQEPVDAGRVLGGDGVIGGLVQHGQDRVSLTTRLLRVSDGAVLRTDSFNERFNTLFEVEDLISQNVVKALAGARDRPALVYAKVDAGLTIICGVIRGSGRCCSAWGSNGCERSPTAIRQAEIRPRGFFQLVCCD